MGSRNYYYFVATLPHIDYGDMPPKSSVDFMEECNYLLHPRDIGLLFYCSYDPGLAVETLESTGSDFIDEFLLRERVLILNLAFLRAAKLGRHAPPDPPQDIPRTVTLARTAFDMEDPLESMLYINRARWGSLNTMMGLDDMFGISNIFIHLLKLQLLERHQRFNREIGLKRYKERYDTILEEYNSKA